MRALRVVQTSGVVQGLTLRKVRERSRPETWDSMSVAGW